jgi:hypothetical protein
MPIGKLIKLVVFIGLVVLLASVLIGARITAESEQVPPVGTSSTSCRTA